MLWLWLWVQVLVLQETPATAAAPEATLAAAASEAILGVAEGAGVVTTPAVTWGGEARHVPMCWGLSLYTEQNPLLLQKTK